MKTWTHNVSFHSWSCANLTEIQYHGSMKKHLNENLAEVFERVFSFSFMSSIQKGSKVGHESQLIMKKLFVIKMSQANCVSFEKYLTKNGTWEVDKI